jgi:hypothetical protein
VKTAEMAARVWLAVIGAAIFAIICLISPLVITDACILPQRGIAERSTR